MQPLPNDFLWLLGCRRSVPVNCFLLVFLYCLIALVAHQKENGVASERKNDVTDPSSPGPGLELNRCHFHPPLVSWREESWDVGLYMSMGRHTT